MAQNYYRLVTVLVNIGAKVLRRFLQHHSGYASLTDLLNGEIHKLYHSWFPRDNVNCCCSARVTVNRSNITKDQFEMLFYKTATSPLCSHSGLHHCWHKVKTGINFEILDITLARLLIVNVITTLSTVDSAALDKIRELRNFLAHSPVISISDHDFELRWNAAKAKILHLANTMPFPFSMEIEQDIDGLKTQSLDDRECNRLREAVKELRQTDRLLEEMSERLVHGVDKLSGDISDVQSTTQTVLETTQSAHRENLELKAEIQEVKGEVKGVRNDIQEIKTEFQGMKCDEIHRDPRLKQLIENTELMLKTHQKNLYAPGNRAEKAAYKHLCGNHHITLLGRGGQGKTTLGKHLMHKFCNEHLVDQERYTPIILENAKDFDLINGKDCFIILIDDPFGKSNRDKGRLEEWESRFEKMLSFIKEGNICLIMCIRLSILKDSSDTLVKYDLFNGENWVDLTSDSYRLTENERFAMLKAYCEKHNVHIFNQKENVVLSQRSPDKMDARAISPVSTTGTQIDHSTLKEISKSDPFLGFPQSCQLFFSRKSFFDKGLEFFKEPDESVKNDIYHMKESAPLQYIVFVFMMLQGGGIDLNKLDEEKLETLCKCLDVKSPSTEDIKECVRYGVSGVYVQKLDSRTSVSKGIQQLVYIFTHETVLESVLLSFGKRYPEIFLQLSEDRLLLAFARPTGYKRKPGEICVSVPSRCHRQFAERFVHEYSYCGIEKLLYDLVYSRFFTDESFVQDVFDVMDEDYVNFRNRNKLFSSHYSLGNLCKTDKDVVQFLVALCKRFALYNQTSSKEYVGEEQSLGKLKLPVDLFIELLHNITEAGENDAVNELLDLSGLDLHLRYRPDIVAEENESDVYEDICDVDERFNFRGKSKFFYYSFGNPVCYACSLGYKDLVLRFLDIMDTVILDEVTERLVYLLIERDWLDVLQKLVDKNRSVLLDIYMPELLNHVLGLRRKSVVLYFLDFDVDLNLTDKYGLILLLHCCQNDWDDIFDKVLQRDKNAIQQNGLSPSLLALQAAKYNRERIVLYLLQYDVDLSACDKNGQTLLHYCCVNDGVDVFDKILEKDKDVLSKADMSPSVLVLHAAKYRRKKMALHLLQLDVDLTVCDENGKTLLHFCCEHEWVDVFEKILEKDKDVLSTPDMSPSVLILLAARYKSTKMISNLLQYEVDFTVSDEHDKTLLHYCCQHGWVDVFDNILDKDQEVLRKPGLSPSALLLHSACFRGKRMVSRLMMFEVDFTMCDANDKTLLHYCCEYHWVDIFDNILEKGKDVLSKVGICLSALVNHAAKCHNRRLVLQLLPFDFDLAVGDEDGNTLIHYCCENGWVDIFEKILEKDKDVLSNPGPSVSDYILRAARCKNLQIVSHLLLYDVDLSVADHDGHSLLHYCCQHDWVDAFDKILEKDEDLLSKPGLSPSALVLHAANNCKKKMASHLLKFEIDFTERDASGKTLLHYCCQHDWVDVFDKVIAKDKDVLSDPGLSPSVLVLHAAKLCSVQVVLRLIQYDVDFTVSDENDKTLLHYCCKHDWVFTLDKVIAKDKDVLSKADLSPSALVHRAAKYYSKRVVLHLLQYDLDFTLCDKKGFTLLHYCCKHDWVDVFDKILEKQKGVLSNLGLSPSVLVLCAARFHSKRMISLLLNYDVDFTVRDNRSKTLLNYCCEFDWVAIFDQVLKKDKIVLSKPETSPSALILHAASHKRTKMVIHLLQYDVDVTLFDKNKTLLIYCCENDWLYIFNLILQKDKVVMSKTVLLPSFLAVLAAVHQSMYIESLLLKHYVNFAVLDENGKTFLHYCCEFDLVDTFEKIVGKDKDVLNKPGLSPSVLVLHAAKSCKKKMVSRLLKFDVDFTLHDGSHKTLLRYCCEHGWVDVFEKILEKDKEVLSKPDMSPSVLVLHAAEYSKKEMVLHLLKYDVDFAGCDGTGKTLLHYCCELGWVDVFEEILEKNKKVLGNPKASPTVLMLHAANYCKKEMVSKLLKFDMNFIVCDEKGKTLLHYCCEHDWVDDFDEILEKDKDVLSKPGMSASVLVLHAAEYSKKEMVLHLLKFDVDFAGCDGKGKTLLHYCCEYDWVDVFDNILQKDTEVLSKPGLSPSVLVLHAAEYSKKKMASKLLKFDIDFTVCDGNGKTLLHYCCGHDWVDVFEEILEKDKDVLSKPKTSTSVLVLNAAEYHRKNMVFHLLHDEVDFTECDKNGKTLLHYCSEYNWNDVFDKILEIDKDVLGKQNLSPSVLILCAANNKSTEMISNLLRYEVDLTVFDENGKTLIHYCCEYDWVDVFDKILQKDTEVLDKPDTSPSVLILNAASYKSTQMILHLLQYEVDFTLSDKNHNTLLKYCCENDWLVIFKKILHKDKDVLSKTVLLPSLLAVVAAVHQSMYIVSLLLKHYVNFAVLDENGKTFLHYCCEFDLVDTFEKILEKDKDVLNKPGLSPSVLVLHAAKSCKKKMVSHLLKYDVDFTLHDGSHKTLLHYCCEHDWVDVFEKILEKDKDVLSKPDMSPSVLVRHAAEYSKKEMVLHLLKYYVDLTGCDGKGKTLLHYCCELGWVHVFDEILEKDKDVLSKPDMSASVLVLHAAEYSKKEMVLHLLKYDVDFAGCDGKGKTLLHYCCEYDWVDVFDNILQKDTEVLSKPGLSPSVLVLHAAEYSKKKMASKLLKFDIDFTVCDGNGKTLLHYCCGHDWVDVFEEILEKDKDVLSNPETSTSVLVLNAAEYHRKNMVFHLLHYEVDFTECAENGKTLLHYCSEYNWNDVFDKILEIDKDVLSKQNLSPSILILCAANNNSTEMISNLLRYEVDLTVFDEIGKTLIHYCCEYDWVDIFDKILQKDAEVLDKPDTSPSVLILHAASYKSTQMILHLLQFEVDFTLSDKNHNTLLKYCCENDWLVIFKKILQKDKDMLSKTVLLPSFLAVVAAVHQSMYIESLLLKHYVNFAVLDENGKTFLHYCCEFDLVDTFEKILEKDKDVLNKPGLSPSVLVLHAAKSCKKKMVSHLLKYDVDFTLHGGSHKTLLHYCCEHDWVDVFEKILEKEKDVLNKPDMSPSALVLHAAEYSKKEMVLHLLKFDVDFSVCDEKGKTLLHYCSECDWVDVFEKILEKDKEVLNKPGMSPSVLVLHAAEYSKKEMVLYLLQYEVDFTLCDENGKTLLHHSSENGWVEILNTILDSRRYVL